MINQDTFTIEKLQDNLLTILKTSTSFFSEDEIDELSTAIKDNDSYKGLKMIEKTIINRVNKVTEITEQLEEKGI